jgi:hypothetical protein
MFSASQFPFYATFGTFETVWQSFSCWNVAYGTAELTEYSEHIDFQDSSKEKEIFIFFYEGFDVQAHQTKNQNYDSP